MGCAGLSALLCFLLGRLHAAHLKCPRNTGVVQGVADYVCVDQHNPETIRVWVMPTAI